jgi:hypothetical protein
LGQPVQAVVRLAHGAYESAESVGLVVAGVAAVLVDLADADLNGSVILGLDDAAGGAALAGDVAITYSSVAIFEDVVGRPGSKCERWRVGLVGNKNVQVDDVTAFVLHGDLCSDEAWSGGCGGCSAVDDVVD